MGGMFRVRTSPCPSPDLQSSPPLHAAWASIARGPPASWLAALPASYALLATRQNANSLSAANKLLIRCAWAGNSAFASAGYDSSWVSGSCPPPPPSPPSWFLAINIHPSDGQNFGWGNWPVGGAARGSAPFGGDYVHAAHYQRTASYIAIARHDNGMCQASRSWRLEVPGESLYNVFKSDSSYQRANLTTGGVAHE
eukprot:scaffold137365_cov75-Phaeocystis_antarctica.AAC.1